MFGEFCVSTVLCVGECLIIVLSSLDDINVCLGTRVRSCCPERNPLPANMLSTSTINVAGDDITLSYYLTEEGGK